MRSSDLFQPLENPVHLIRRDSRTLISHRDDEVLGGSIYIDLDRRAVPVASPRVIRIVRV